MNILYVDDELAAIQKFKTVVTKLSDVNEVNISKRTTGYRLRENAYDRYRVSRY